MISRSFIFMLMVTNFLLVKPFPEHLMFHTQKSTASFEPVFQKGMSYATYANLTPDAYSSVESDESLRRMKQIGVEWLAVNVVWFQKNVSSTKIYPHSNESPSNSSIVHVIEKAHRLSMKVMLKPKIDLEDGHWSGDVVPSQQWFQSYTSFINFFADLAKQNKAEMLCVGTELVRTASWEQKWRDIISGVRQRYSGLLTYAAIWWKEYDELVKWWDALDYVGINAYFPLSDKNNATITEMKSTWVNIANYLDSFYSKVKKPIIFTEIGYLSTDGTNKDPSNWRLQNVPGRLIDLQEQADCYEAAFQELWRKSWFFGFYWWYWQTNPDAGGSSNSDYTPQNKPAQGVITHWYSLKRQLGTTLTLNLDKKNTTLGDSLTLTANLSDENNYPLSNADVDFYLFENIETKVGSSITNSAGVATFTLQPNNTGVFQLKAKFNETQNYGASMSDTMVLNVKGVDYTPYIIGGISLLVVIEAIIIGVFWRKRKSLSKVVPKG